MFNIGERQHLDERDRLWLGSSLFWGFGCEYALLAVMTHGGAIVLQEGFDWLTSRSFPRARSGRSRSS